MKNKLNYDEEGNVIIKETKIGRIKIELTEELKEQLEQLNEETIKEVLEKQIKE